MDTADPESRQTFHITETRTCTRRLEELKRKAGAAAEAGAAAKEDQKQKDRMENKWAYVGDKLVATPVERKGPKKP
eukprot:1747056-Rhodomonas_salina.1